MPRCAARDIPASWLIWLTSSRLSEPPRWVPQKPEVSKMQRGAVLLVDRARRTPFRLANSLAATGEQAITLPIAFTWIGAAHPGLRAQRP